MSPAPLPLDPPLLVALRSASGVSDELQFKRASSTKLLMSEDRSKERGRMVVLGAGVRARALSPKTQVRIVTSRGWDDQLEAVVQRLPRCDREGSVDARGNNGVGL